MTPQLAVHRKLDQAARRIRLLLVSQWVARAICWTALACAAWIAAAKLEWLAEPGAWTVAVVLTVAGALGAAVGGTRRITRMDVARLTDERTGLKERLSSAVEFERTATANPVARLQLDDAGQHATGLDLRRAYPIRLTREMIAAVALGLAVFLALLLPSMPVFWSREHRQEVADVKRWAAAIEKPIHLAEKSAAQQKLDETAKAAKEAQKLAEAMKRQNLSMKGAMVGMTKLTKQMQEQIRRMADANEASRLQMQKASADIKRSLADQQKQVQQAAAAKAAEAKKNAGQKGPKPGDRAAQQEAQKQAEQQARNALAQRQQSPAMQQAQQALQKFAQALADQNFQAQNQALQQLADQMQSGQITPQEMQSLQQQLQQMAQALQGTPMKDAAKQLAQIAQMMRQIKLDPETLKKLASLMRQAGGMCKGAGRGQLDAKTLAELLEALKNAKELRMAEGSGLGIPIPLPVPGAGGRGMGTNGAGHPSTPMKDGKASSPRLVAVGKNGALTADARVSKEFLKYAAMGHKDSKFAPNAKIQGVRNKNFTELQQNFTGNPDSRYSAGTPLFQANVHGGRAAENPVDRENIPAAMRKQVKDYFETINPNR